MTIQEITAGLWVIAGLIVIEGLLSVDNVLGIAALANELPEHQQKKAIRLGLAGAYLFRVGALLIAAWLVSNSWVRWVGAGYLIWLMCSHLTRHQPPAANEAEEAEHPTEDTVTLGTVTGSTEAAFTEPASDRLQVHPAPAAGRAGATLAGVLLQIGLMDLSLSIDNVIAAVGLAHKHPDGTPVMWPIYTGVAFAILALQAIAPHAVRLLKKYPILEPTAFVLIGYVGCLLLGEEIYHVATGVAPHVPVYYKFAGILLIMWIALLYSADGSVRKTLQPLIRAVHPVMKLLSFTWIKRRPAA